MVIRKVIYLILLINLCSCTAREKKEMKKESFEIINQYLVPNELEGVRRWLFLDIFTTIGRLNSIKKNYKIDEFLILTCANIRDSSKLEIAYDILTVDLEYNVNEETFPVNHYAIKKKNLNATLIQVSEKFILENYSESYEKEVFEFRRNMTANEDSVSFKNKIIKLKQDPQNVYLLGVGNKSEIPGIESRQLLPK